MATPVTDQDELAVRFPGLPKSVDEWAEQQRQLPESTSDDVGIRLADGRHLRTRREVLEFLSVQQRIGRPSLTLGWS